MAKDQFNFNGTLTPKSLAALFNSGSRESRDKLRTVALSVLQSTHRLGLDFNQNTFGRLLRGMEHSLNNDQQSVAMNIYLDASGAYQQWCASRSNKPNSNRRINYNRSHVNGGSGYTGRLKVGFAAPNGSESFQSDDDPREGMKLWVKKLTAEGSGAGYSLGELSGARQPKSYGVVMPVGDLRFLTRNQLLNILDTATSPGTFLRAILTYYNQPMIVSLGNVSINSANINNPENRRSIAHLDSIYSHMKELDKGNIITPDRAMRSLVLSSDLLELVKVKKPRRADIRTMEIYNERAREVRVARMEIQSELKDVSSLSDITPGQMRRQIVDDKRKRQWQVLNAARISP